MSRPNNLFKKLYRKQKGNCHLCGAGMTKQSGKPNSATFDHIVPLSTMRKNSIAHIPQNKKLACKSCNEKRGNTPIKDIENER